MWDPSGIWSASLVTRMTLKASIDTDTQWRAALTSGSLETYQPFFLRQKDLPLLNNTLEATATEHGFLPE